MIITGVIEAIKTLKEPCIINLYTHTYLEFKTKKCTNKDLINELKKSIKDNEHILKEVVSQKKQKELANILSVIFKNAICNDLISKKKILNKFCVDVGKMIIGNQIYTYFKA